ncbi:WD40/YVTN/BNR-like repeat-containing protein [Candidatus Poriferisodalis sp.]|uniref:WD40/YVTN/BNR-like repeat-containing protein n=1 Tax=Candidatus Poriferisodalis sp. TaxID=3101277 RepID=UPI003B52A35C
MNGQLLAGTTRGVFVVDGTGSTQTLDARHVRDLVNLDGRVLAGSAAGLHTSEDGGRTWSGPQLEGRDVWQIRAAPGGRLYASTEPAGLFRSDDQGETWSEITSFAALPEAERWCVPVEPPQPGRARALVIDEHDPDRIWVGVEVGGVARSTDGGASWSVDLPGGNPDIHMMFAHPAEPGVLFVSTGYGRFDGVAEELEGNAGVFRSDDYGETWDYAWKGVVPRYSRPLCIDCRDPYSVTVASAPTAFSHYKDDGGANAALYRSDDHGQSWRSLCDEAHSPSPVNFHGLIADPANVGGVLVGTDTGEVWQVSEDAQWTELGSGLPLVWSLVMV